MARVKHEPGFSLVPTNQSINKLTFILMMVEANLSRVPITSAEGFLSDDER